MKWIELTEPTMASINTTSVCFEFALSFLDFWSIGNLSNNCRPKQSYPTGRSKRDERAYFSKKRESLASIPEELELAGLVVGAAGWRRPKEEMPRAGDSGWRGPILSRNEPVKAG